MEYSVIYCETFAYSFFFFFSNKKTNYSNEKAFKTKKCRHDLNKYENLSKVHFSSIHHGSPHGRTSTSDFCTDPLK